MRWIVAFAVALTTLVLLSGIRLSKGETLPLPSSALDVTVRP
jgi:hypothetical protein